MTNRPAIRLVARPLRVTAVLASVLVVLVVVLWSLQRRLVYFPAGAPPTVERVLPDGRAVTLLTDDGLELGAWWLSGGPTAVAVFPGNAGNRAGRAPLARALHGLGLSVLLVDYRGYGGNPGSPDEEGLLADGRAAAAWLDADPSVRHTVLFGESLGAAVAIGVAAGGPPPAALVLRSPFTSLADVARAHYGPVPEWMLQDRFPSIDRIPDVAVPVLVAATRSDEVVPFDQSQRLHDAAGEPKRLVVVDAAGHNDPALSDGRDLIAAVARFLADHDLLATG